MKLLIVLLLFFSGTVFAQIDKNYLFKYSDTCNCNGKRDSCFGYRDINGKHITKAIYSQIDFDTLKSSCSYVITCTGKFKAINNKGVELFDFFPYDNGPDYFQDGYARYIDNDKIGFVDTTFNKVIMAQYDFATPFEHGLSAFCIGCKEVPVYPIDRNGKELIEKHPEHFRFSGGKWGFINKKNIVVVEPQLDDVIGFDSIKVTTVKNKVKTTYSFSSLWKNRNKGAR